jgi:hypothetical protein
LAVEAIDATTFSGDRPGFACRIRAAIAAAWGAAADVPQKMNPLFEGKKKDVLVQSTAAMSGFGIVSSRGGAGSLPSTGPK